VTVASNRDIYYDPYDFEIDADPYPIWKRMRDESPLYYNEKYDFYALSRYEDVDACLLDWATYSSAKGSILELIRANMEIPSGAILFEDPPAHHVHRSLLSRVFTPRKMNALEPKVRKFCADSLDPLVGSGKFDFVADLGAQMPMRTIGMLLGIPEQDQEAIRDHIDEGLRMEEGEEFSFDDANLEAQNELFGQYIDWRADHPSDDLMTELLNAEFEDENGTERKLNRDEVLTVVGLIAGAGNETTARLIGWTGKVLAEHPDQRRQLVEDRSLVPNAIEDGETFDVRRDGGRHLAFGFGIHLCLGAALARLEGRVALDEVLQRFPEWEVDYDNATRARTSTVRGWDSLPVFTR
jgi:cytochrome P450